MRRFVPISLLLTAVFSLLLSCGEDANSLYAGMRAFFRFNAVTTTAPLYGALNNPGQFCKITFPAGAYRFENADGVSAVYTPTAVAQYGKPVYVAGFIVGTPAIPDFSGASVVAYDLVCPNCYSDNALQRSLDFASATTMKCSRCNRTYDLNNAGNVSSSGGGRALYRYHVTYSATQGGVIVILY